MPRHKSSIDTLRMPPHSEEAEQSVLGSLMLDKNAITKIARMRGITEGSEAEQRLMQWMAEEPPAELFEAALHATRLMLDALPPEERERSRQELLLHCNQIAHAIYGRMWGHDVVYGEEEMIAHIAEEIS